MIITEADKISLNTQNILLKTLEETSLNILFILITDRPNALLQTITSRSWEIKFSPIHFESLFTFIKDKNDCLTDENIENLILLNNYNIHNILENLDDAKNDIKFDFQKYFELIHQSKIYESNNMLIKFKVLEEKKISILILRQLQNIFENLLKIDKINKTDNEFYQKFSDRINNKKLDEVIDFLIKAEEYVKRNSLLSLLWLNVTLKIHSSFLI